MDDFVEILDETLKDAAILYNLKIPPVETAKCTLRSETKNCKGCEFEPFCISCCTVKLNILTAQLDRDESYSLVDDINRIFTAASAGITVEPNEPKGVF